jgi:glycosyltransferase involved in cell wall biosynthesis
LHYGDVTATEWEGDADVNSVNELAKLARSISASDNDVVSLQHEFGIWGGAEGEHIHAFLDNLTKPVLSVLHTTFGPGTKSAIQADIVLRLIRESAIVVVLTAASKQSLEMLAGGDIKKLVVLPHGLPDYPYIAPPPHWSNEKHRIDRPLRLITPGYFRQDKGLEVVLHAVRELRDRGYCLSYVIAGEPQRQFSQQEPYRAYIEHLIGARELRQEVHIEDRYLSLDEQATFIRQAHAGVFGYQDLLLASSGTVPLVMSMGRPVICAPFEYARTKVGEVPGIFLAAGFDASAFANAIEKFIHTEAYETVAEATYRGTRPWLWSGIGRAFAELLVAGASCC